MLKKIKKSPAKPASMCGKCGRPAKVSPRKWDGQTWCNECWRGEFRIVGLTVPITAIIEWPEDVKEEDRWSQLWSEFRDVSRQVGRAFTWTTNVLYQKDDAVRLPADQLRDKKTGKVSLGPPPKCGVYNSKMDDPQLRALWPDIASGIASQISREASLKYNARRWDIFTGSRTPQYFEMPIPVRAQNYKLSAVEKPGEPRILTASFSLRSGNNRRWTLRLGNRRRFARQLATIDDVIQGKNRKVGAQVLEVRGNRGRGRDIGFKVVCWIRKSERDAGSNTMILKTSGDHFMNVRIMGRDRDEKWTNEDHVKRKLAALRYRTDRHARRMARLAQDQKVERRLHMEADLSVQRDRFVRSHSNWMKNWIGEKSAQISAAAVRAGCFEIVIDDSDKGWIERFNWSGLWERLRTKCDELRIRVITSDQKEREIGDAKNIAIFQALMAEIGRESSDQVKPNGDTE